jgi:hypothetical protein
MVDILSDIQRLSWSAVCKAEVRDRKRAACHDGGERASRCGLARTLFAPFDLYHRTAEDVSNRDSIFCEHVGLNGVLLLILLSLVGRVDKKI